MAIINGRLLGLIDRLFQFKAGSVSAPLEYSVESPIQPVHEVGRPAELAAGFGAQIAPGYWIIGVANVHAAGGEDVFSTIDPRTAIDGGSPGVPVPKPAEYDVWWLGSTCYSTTAGIIVVGSNNLALYFPIMPSAASLATIRVPFLLFSADASIAICDVAGTAAANMARSTATNNGFPRPILIPQGGTLHQRTNATVATPGTIIIASLCWAGPRGARPPGLA